MAAWEDGFRESQQRLAGLSSNAAHIVVTGVGHSIAMEHPALVAAAIEAVVEASRTGELNVAEVRRLAATAPR